MWIVGSTLSISQRSLMGEHPASDAQRTAQRLAHNLIQSYSARHAVREAIDFVIGYVSCEVQAEGDWLRIALSTDPLAGLGIPPGYGVKGGAAREALAVALGLRDLRQPRDIDVVRRGKHPLPLDEEVARSLMPRDFAHGARVELIRELPRYLTSRDLTVNEVVAEGSTVNVSLIGALDSIGQVLRPARYRGGTLHRKPSLHGQSLLKMARLYAEGACEGESWSIEGIPEEVTFSEFDLAVHLNKAFQRGRPVVERFLHTCILLSLITASEDPVRDALEHLEHLRHGERGLLPDVPAEEWARI